MSSCVLQQLLANKTVLVQFFPGSFASTFEMTKSFLYRDLAGCLLQVASLDVGCGFTIL